RLGCWRRRHIRTSTAPHGGPPVLLRHSREAVGRNPLRGQDRDTSLSLTSRLCHAPLHAVACDVAAVCCSTLRAGAALDHHRSLHLWQLRSTALPCGFRAGAEWPWRSLHSR